VKWLDSGHTSCPQTRQPLQAHQLVSNYLVRQLLEQLQQQTVISPALASTTPSQGPSNGQAVQQVGRPAPVAPRAEALVSWQEALAAAKANPGNVQAWQLLGKCLAGQETVILSKAFAESEAETERCVTAFSLHTAHYLTNLKSLDLSRNDRKVVALQLWHSMQPATGPSCTP
jgi:hypothetical protein